MFESSYIKLPHCEKDSDQNIFHQKLLKQWIKELPVDNQGEKARSLFNQIYRFNRIALPPGDRLNSLDLLVSTYLPVQQFLYSRLARNGFPLDDKSRKISQLLLDFGREFATGYCLVLDSLSSGLKQRGASNDLTLVIQRSIRSLGAVLLLYYLFTLKQPAAIWHDMNALFRLAAKMKKLTVKIKDNALLYGETTTIEQTYKNFAILSLLDPYHLDSEELFDAHHLLEKWSPLVEMKKVQETGELREKQWRIDLGAPHSPSLSTNAKGEDESHWLFRFDFDNLLRMVADHRDLVDPGLGRFETHGNELHREKLSLEFLEYLEKKAAGQRDESDEIFRKDHEYRLAIGLKATHDQLNRQHEREESIHGEWLAMGEGGNRLHCEFSVPEQVSIGSLVSYCSADDENAMRGLGVIGRIIMNDLEGTVQFEIERFTARVFAAGLQPNVRASKELKVYQRALVYTQTSGRTARHYLVVESTRPSPSDTFRILVENDVFPARLTHRKNIAKGCLSFEYSPVVEKSQESPVKRT